MQIRRTWLAGLALLGSLAIIAAVFFSGSRLISATAVDISPRTKINAPRVEGAIMAVQAPAGPTQVEANFEVTITVDMVGTPAGAFQFDLAYNPAVIAFRYAEAGDFLTATNRDLVCPPEAFDQGTLRLACATAGETPGPTGSGELVVLVFQGLADGISGLSLSNAQLATTGRPPSLITTTLQDGQVTVGTPPDASTKIYLPVITSN